MNFNKKSIIGIGVLSAAMLVGCNPGGNTPTEKKMTDITIGYKDSSRTFYFGDRITKSDFVVNAVYSDGSSSVLKDDEYKVTEYNGLKHEEVEFPYALSYKGPMDTSRNFVFHTNDGSCAKSLRDFNIKKQYHFEYGDGTLNDFTLYKKDDAKISIDNKLYKGSSVVTGATYSSNKPKVIQEQDSEFSYTGSLADFPNTIIKAYVDDVCVDDYRISKFKHNVAGMGNETGIYLTCTLEDSEKSTYNPNGDGSLYFPSIWEGEFITNISKPTGKNFSNCALISKIEIPESIKVIEKDSFKNCTNLSSTITIPSSVYSIGTNAFFNTDNAKFEFEKTNGWLYTYEGETYSIESERLKDTNTATWLLHQENASLLNIAE